jgi:hypothetical protein
MRDVLKFDLIFPKRPALSFIAMENERELEQTIAAFDLPICRVRLQAHPRLASWRISFDQRAFQDVLARKTVFAGNSRGTGARQRCKKYASRGFTVYVCPFGGKGGRSIEDDLVFVPYNPRFSWDQTARVWKPRW